MTISQSEERERGKKIKGGGKEKSEWENEWMTRFMTWFVNQSLVWVFLQQKLMSVSDLQMMMDTFVVLLLP